MDNLDDINEEESSASNNDVLKEFIDKFEVLPELWNSTHPFYMKKDKRLKALNKLLIIYQKVKQNATMDDGENTSTNLSITEDPKRAEDPETREKASINSLSRSLPKRTQKRKGDDTLSKQNQLLSIACEYLSKSDGESDIAKVWAGKIKSLPPDQKLFAEKAINDVLFEAQLGKLNRYSVRINQDAQSLSPLSSRSTIQSNSYSYANSPADESINAPEEVQMPSCSSPQSSISPTYSNQENQENISIFYSNYSTYTDY